MKKKNVSKFMMGLIVIIFGLFYFYYLSNRTPKMDATDIAVDNNTLAEELIAKDIKDDYPDTPKEVIKLYAKITTAYYQTELTDEQIDSLGRQARILFDDELKATQSEKDFLEALNKDIKEYRSLNRYIADYYIQQAGDVRYTDFQGKKYASIVTLYNIREKSNLTDSYTKFTLRKDNNGKWKILYWELTDKDSM